MRFDLYYFGGRGASSSRGGGGAGITNAQKEKADSMKKKLSELGGSDFVLSKKTNAIGDVAFKYTKSNGKKRYGYITKSGKAISTDNPIEV